MELVYTIMCILPLLLTTLAQSGSKPLPLPSTLGRPREKVSNQTMDEIITGTLGGVDVASNMILADDRHILAELDMYLTNEQFIGMYQRPSQDDMNQMNSTVGVPKIYNYLHDSTEEDYKGSGIRTKRKAVREYRLRWTNAEIPYLFARGHFTVNEEYMMRRSMTEWERYTCLKFRPANLQDKNSVRFQNGVGCNSQLGMVGGVQVLNLQAPGCRYKGLYLHEIGHAIGLVHEHQLPDRDKYISVLYQNVAPHMRVWFNKYTSNEVNQMTVPYEYSSVMHYGITAFAYDGKAQTIRAHDKAKEELIGKVYLKELAYTDVHIVNLMYNCSGHCANQNQCGPNGYLDQKCNCICRDGSSDCDISKKVTDETCVNLYDSWSCYIWANQGECERNPLYMKQQCAKACQVCGGSVKTQENNFILWPWQWFPMFANMLPKEWTKLGGCKDSYDQIKCKIWQERGDCITNKRWMKDNCKSTCNLCSSPETRSEVNCDNEYEDNVKCDDWAKDGECSVNTNWMNSKCRKSCEACNKEKTDSGDEDEEIDEDNMVCENTNPSCEAWANSGECQSNPSWMISNCRQACQKCDDGTCKNFYDDVQCKIWAQKQECMVNSDWMSKHCARACGRGLCKGTNPDSDTTTPIIGRKATVRPTTVSTVACQNKHRSDTECDIWANSGHCSVNPGWMKVNCAKSCQACSGGSNSKETRTTDSGTATANYCEDSEAGCAGWAKHGFCDSNPKYNLLFCKKSCNNCNGCRDTEFLCAVWAKDGHCDKNPRYMMRHCQMSCRACYMHPK
uniref:Metalloendopeptidase n=1 Tax=Arion vulgaris TaxID=1028688 RepID=A0A0B6ZGY8_9EUPU